MGFRPRVELPALLALLLTLFFVPSAFAQSKAEEESRRQLEFAKGEITAGNFEKALGSADSALRLDPSLHQAMYVKGLAYEGLGNLKMAESLVLAYFEISRVKPEQDPDAKAALERIQGKLGTGTGKGPERRSEREAAPPMATEAPPLPKGSEEFLRWLIAHDAEQRFIVQRDVGIGLLVSGAVLAGGGGAVMGITSALSASRPNDANVEAFYAAGVASLFTGGASVIVGTILAGDAGGKMKKAQLGLLTLVMEPTATGFALRF